MRTGSAWALGSAVVALCSGLVRTVVLARFLEPVEIGVMGIALLALAFVEAVASTGVDTALVAEQNDVERYIDPAFTIQLARGLIVFGLLWVGAPAISWAFKNDAAIDVIRSVGLIAALRGVANPAVVVAIRGLDFRRVFWWSLPEVLTTLCVALVLGFVRRDVWALVIAVVCGQAVGTIASYGLVPRMPRLALKRERIHELLRFGRFVSGSRALMYFSVNLDATVVGITMGTHSLGLYQFAKRVAELPVGTFTRAVGQVALPALSGTHASAAALSRTWRTMLVSVVGMNAVAAVVLLMVGESAVEAVAGRQWLPAVPILKILAVAMLFRAVVVLTGQLLDARGQPSLTLRLNAVRLGTLLVVLPPLAAWGGLHGVAQAVVLSSAGGALLALRLSGRVLSEKA